MAPPPESEVTRREFEWLRERVKEGEEDHLEEVRGLRREIREFREEVAERFDKVDGDHEDQAAVNWKGVSATLAATVTGVAVPIATAIILTGGRG